MSLRVEIKSSKSKRHTIAYNVELVQLSASASLDVIGKCEMHDTYYLWSLADKQVQHGGYVQPYNLECPLVPPTL